MLVCGESVAKGAAGCVRCAQCGSRCVRVACGACGVVCNEVEIRVCRRAASGRQR